MSTDLISQQNNARGIQRRESAPPGWPAEPPDDETDEPGVPWRRYLGAIYRYKWLVLALTIAGVGGGVFVARRVKSSFVVRATVWISSPNPVQRSDGPIRAEELLASGSWVELFKSFAIVDSVVMKRRAYIAPVNRGDSAIFNGLRIGNGLLTNDYVLTVDSTGHRYSLLVKGRDTPIESGAVGDSVGRRIGVAWLPPAGALTANRQVRFHLTTPRDAAIALLDSLTPTLQPGSSFMRLTLRAADANDGAATLNLWIQEFVATSAELKRRNLTTFSKILSDQLSYAARQLRDADNALSTFRVNTITEPSDALAIAPGLEVTQGPVFQAYFNRKIEYDNVRRNRELLEHALDDVAAGRENAEVVASIPGILQLPGAENLAAVVRDLYQKEADLRQKERIFTSEHQTVQTLQTDLAGLRTQTIPRLSGELLTQLRAREADLKERIAGGSRELKGIPMRSIEDMRLRREQSVAENLYSSLQRRYDEAKLAEASSVPDVTTLDMAAPPDLPDGDPRIRIIGLALLLGFGAGIAVAIILDRLDVKFRYPEQVTNELRLPISATVPLLPKRRNRDPEEESQIVEAFRGLRLRLQHSVTPGDPIVCTVTSTGRGDGKSTISSNLALSLAEAGYRTLLIDGDTRCGRLHEIFSVQRRPGLIECLTDMATPAQVMRPTRRDRLTLIPSGARDRTNPEAVAGGAFPRLLAQLRTQFDAIVIDSPPMGAGIDAFALSAASGNVLVVLRHGQTDLRMTKAKLEILRRLPITTIGAILNGIKSEGVYRYYSYAPIYYAPEYDGERGETTAAVDQLTAGG
jgi:capsular exopolysaccharide synthesis family protein